MTLPDLEAAVAMLRRQNVAKFTDIAGGGFTVEFFPAPIEAGPVEKSQAQDTKCACGHAMHEHNASAGLCLLGCDPEKCAGAEAKS